MTKTRRTPSQAKRAELERRLKDIRNQETTIKERIYKLEASIAAAPGLASERRLRMWNTVPADEAAALPSRLKPTRYQRRLANRGRSHQALWALSMMGLAVILALWLSYQLKTSGLL
jgi:hypothetical protein